MTERRIKYQGAVKDHLDSTQARLAVDIRIPCQTRNWQRADGKLSYLIRENGPIGLEIFDFKTMEVSAANGAQGIDSGFERPDVIIVRDEWIDLNSHLKEWPE